MKVDKVEGFAELEQALKSELPKAIARGVLRRAGMKAMQPVADRMKELAPRDEGELAESMKVQAAKAKLIRAMGYDRQRTVVILAGPAPETPQGRANAGFQEFGTVKMAAQPYARPAADSTAEGVIADIKDELATEIEKAKARIARKAARAAKG